METKSRWKKPGNPCRIISLLCMVLAGCGGGTSPSAISNSTQPPAVSSPNSAETDAGSGTDTTASPGQQPAVLRIERALDTGDLSDVGSSEELIDAAIAEINHSRNLSIESITELFNLQEDGTAKPDGLSLERIDWNPTHDAALLTPAFGRNSALLQTNAVANTEYEIDNKVIGVIGQQPSRNIVLGGNPMRNYHRDASSLNDEMHQLLINSVAWLMGRKKVHTSSFNVVIAHVDQSYYFPDETAIRKWLDEKYADRVSYNLADSCDNTTLDNCLNNETDLLIISQVMSSSDNPVQISNTVKNAMEQGIPVLYLHHDGGLTELGASLMEVFGVSYFADNYWRKLSLTNFDITDSIHSLPVEISAVATALTHFKHQDYSFDWSACDDENCSAVAGLQSEFLNAAEHIRNFLIDLDTRKIDLFASEDLKLYKLMVLLGDHFRQSVTYPMDKVTTDDTQLMRAYFADHTVHHYRNRVNTQTRDVLDLGNFSRGDFSHIIPESKTITLTSKQRFRAAGVYALPGQTFKVTRNDHSDLTVKVFVNTQRSGSTHQWAENGYSRPKFLQSPSIEISQAETITITSPYGGPVQLWFDKNDLDVELSFENIGLHAYWRNPADDDIFAQRLDAAEFDWAELASPGFEVHSTLEKMKTSMTDRALDTNVSAAQAISAATMRYVHNFPHVLAGFQGPGVDEIPEIHDFATDLNLPIDNLDLVKHMNADQATCGYGCSGNPYDAYWSFSPVGHGDIHELGHGLEKKRLRFEGWETHTMTNMYSYYTKSQFHKDTGKDPDCQSLPFESSFNILQQSLTTNDPAGYVKTKLWDTMGWSEGAAMFVQLMMSAQDNNALVNGWHLLARLHILEREFSRTVQTDEANWQLRRDNLGFSQYSLAQAKAIGNNDWLLVAISFATGFDYTDYFELWALPSTSMASSQVQQFSFPVMPLNYYVTSPNGFCKGQGFDGASVPLNGTASWPLAQ